MTRRNFYTMALWLPVAWPVIVSLCEAFLHAFTWHQMSKVSGVIILSGMFGGIQYLFFAVLISFRFANKDIEYIQRAVWFLPLAFTVICSVGIWCFLRFVSMQANLMQVRTGASAPIDMLAACTNIALFTLGIGYAYLVVLQTFIALLETFGFFED